MIDPTTLLSATVAVYLVSFVVLGVVVRRVPRSLRSDGYLLVGVVGLMAVNLLCQRFEIGAVSGANGSVYLTAVLAQTVGSVVLYGVITRLAGVSTRMSAAVIVLALVPLQVGNLTTLFSVPSVVETLSLVAFFVPFPVLVYLFVRPIWQTAQDTSEFRRLLHWKARNVALFVYGSLLSYILLAVSGLVSDPVLTQFLLQYVAYVFYVGVPAFLVYRFVSLGDRLGAELTTGQPSRLGD